jgi:hypothetical protein
MIVFTLDVSSKHFSRLPSITPVEIVQLLHQLLANGSFVPVDPESDSDGID